MGKKRINRNISKATAEILTISKIIRLKIDLEEAIRDGDLVLVQQLMCDEDLGDFDIDEPLTDQNTALSIAIEHNHAQIVKFLLDSCNASVSSSKSKYSLLLLAAMCPAPHTVFSLLLEHFCSITDEVTENNETCLMVAIRQGSRDLVSLILRELRGDEVSRFVDREASDGTNALHCAVIGGDLQIVTEVAQYCSKESHLAKNEDGETPLYLACKLGSFNLIWPLYAGPGSSVFSIAANCGMYPIHIAAMKGHKNILSSLVRYGDNPDARMCTPEGATALHIAAMHGRADCCRVLVQDCGANINVSTLVKNGKTPLQFAAFYGHAPVCETLVLLNPDVTSPSNINAISIASLKNSVDCVKALVSPPSRFSIDSVSPFPECGGLTALMIAAKHGFPELAKFCLMQGCDPLIASPEGYTAAHLAALSHSIEVITVLIRHSPMLMKVELAGSYDSERKRRPGRKAETPQSIIRRNWKNDEVEGIMALIEATDVMPETPIRRSSSDSAMSSASSSISFPSAPSSSSRSSNFGRRSAEGGSQRDHVSPSWNDNADCSCDGSNFFLQFTDARESPLFIEREDEKELEKSALPPVFRTRKTSLSRSSSGAEGKKKPGKTRRSMSFGKSSSCSLQLPLVCVEENCHIPAEPSTSSLNNISVQTKPMFGSSPAHSVPRVRSAPPVPPPPPSPSPPPPPPPSPPSPPPLQQPLSRPPPPFGLAPDSPAFVRQMDVSPTPKERIISENVVDPIPDPMHLPSVNSSLHSPFFDDLESSLVSKTRIVLSMMYEAIDNGDIRSLNARFTSLGKIYPLHSLTSLFSPQNLPKFVENKDSEPLLPLLHCLCLRNDPSFLSEFLASCPDHVVRSLSSIPAPPSYLTALEFVIYRLGEKALPIVEVLLTDYHNRISRGDEDEDECFSDRRSKREKDKGCQLIEYAMQFEPHSCSVLPLLLEEYFGFHSARSNGCHLSCLESSVLCGCPTCISLLRLQIPSSKPEEVHSGFPSIPTTPPPTEIPENLFPIPKLDTRFGVSPSPSLPPPPPSRSSLSHVESFMNEGDDSSNEDGASVAVSSVCLENAILTSSRAILDASMMQQVLKEDIEFSKDGDLVAVEMTDSARTSPGPSNIDEIVCSLGSNLVEAARKGNTEQIGKILASISSSKPSSPLSSKGMVSTNNGFFRSAVLSFIDPSSGRNALHSACFYRHPECVTSLLQHGAVPDTLSQQGYRLSPLHIAASAGDIQIISLLLIHNANVNIAGADGGITPLICAAKGNHVRAAEILIQYGAIVNASEKRNGWTSLHHVVLLGNTDFASMLLNSGALVSIKSCDGLTPLHIACREDHVQVVTLLIEQGANRNVCDSNGLTPLMYAAKPGHNDVVRILLRHSATVGKRTHAGLTALHYATMHGNLEVCKMLIGAGADVSIADDLGLTPHKLSECKDPTFQVGFRDALIEARSKKCQEVSSPSTSNSSSLSFSPRVLDDEDSEVESPRASQDQAQSPSPSHLQRNLKSQQPSNQRKPRVSMSKAAKNMNNDDAQPSPLVNISNDLVIFPEEMKLTGKTLGTGAFGTVREGLLRDVTKVAIKNVATECSRLTMESFSHEIAILKKMHHPNIVLLLGVAWEAPELKLVTELCEMGSLFDVLHSENQRSNRKRLTEGLKHKILLGSAKGMLALHSRFIAHRDLKSANILLSQSYVPKIADFGLAKIRSSGVFNTFVGTLHWMAPEIMDESGHDERCDIYSYAMVMWEVFEEEIPFSQLSKPKVMNAVLNGNERPKFNRTPKKYKNLIEQCWQRRPSDRPSFKQVCLELMRIRPE